MHRRDMEDHMRKPDGAHLLIWSSRAAQWPVRIKSSYGICVTVYKLPADLFVSKSTRDAKIHNVEVPSSADPCFPLFYLEESCELSGLIFCDSLDALHLAISKPR